MGGPCVDAAGISQVITALAAGTAVIITAVTALVLARTAAARAEEDRSKEQRKR